MPENFIIVAAAVLFLMCIVANELTEYDRYSKADWRYYRKYVKPFLPFRKFQKSVKELEKSLSIMGKTAATAGEAMRNMFVLGEKVPRHNLTAKDFDKSQIHTSCDWGVEPSKQVVITYGIKDGQIYILNETRNERNSN